MSYHLTDKRGVMRPTSWWISRAHGIVERATTPGMTYAEVGAEFGISRQRVKQLVVAKLGSSERRWRGRTESDWRAELVRALDDDTATTWNDIAARIGVTVVTLRHWRKKWPDLDRRGQRKMARVHELARRRLRADVVIAYRAWSALAGRRPLAHECLFPHRHGLPGVLHYGNVHNHFGGIHELDAAANDPTFPTEHPYGTR